MFSSPFDEWSERITFKELNEIINSNKFQCNLFKNMEDIIKDKQKQKNEIPIENVIGQLQGKLNGAFR